MAKVSPSKNYRRGLETFFLYGDSSVWRSQPDVNQRRDRGVCLLEMVQGPPNARLACDFSVTTRVAGSRLSELHDKVVVHIVHETKLEHVVTLDFSAIFLFKVQQQFIVQQEGSMFMLFVRLH